MQLVDATKDYLDYLVHEQGATRATVRTYKSGLNQFATWAAANVDPVANLTHLNLPTFRRYLYAESVRGLRPRTLLVKFHPLRGLIRFLIANGAMTENPWTVSPCPRKTPPCASPSPQRRCWRCLMSARASQGRSAASWDAASSPAWSTQGSDGRR